MTEYCPETAGQSEPGADLVDWVEANVHPRLGPEWYGKLVANAGGDAQLAQKRLWEVLYVMAGEEATPQE